MNKQDSTLTKDIILVPTDFSEVCGNAVQHAAKLAEFLNHKLAIIHIIENKAETSIKKKNAKNKTISERLNQYKLFHEKKHGITVETMMKEGNIFTSINKTAADLPAGLMVMGTHGKKGMQYFTGSYILKVVDKSPVPVIVVRKRTFHGKYNRILIPVTDDLHPDKKISWAKHFSKMFNANIHLYQYLHNDKHQRDRLSGFMDKIRRSFEKDEIPFHISKAEKETRFSTQVMSYAVSNKCDLIMFIDINHNVSSAAWYEGLLFNRKQIPVMTINLAKIKAPEGFKTPHPAK